MELTTWPLLLPSILSLFFSGILSQKCPKSTDYVRRVGQTRFYVLQKNARGSFTTWNSAFGMCQKYGMKLARIDKITTFSQVSLPLGYFIDKNKLMDTWYWIGAKYDDDDDKYKWMDSPTSPGEGYLNYTNFYYRQPRPTGVGGHVDSSGRYNVNRDADQCLAFAYPLPGLARASGEYGHTATFEERACEGKTARHALCEASVKDCKLPDPGPYVLSEGKEQYFDEGNWIFGKRRYIVNWAQRDHASSKAYCESMGLQLYNPSLEDSCLIPYLKMWARNITSSQFWTSWSYTRKDGRFRDHKGKVKAKNFAQNKKWDEGTGAVRSSKKDDKFCVSLNHNYEFRSQMPCPSRDPHICQWHFVSYVPANCFNPQGVICQHPDYENRQCIWKKEYIDDVSHALIEQAVVPFGFTGNKEYLRSTYKQTFGSMYCPTGYSLVRARNRNWSHYPKSLPAGAIIFRYDYFETYWLVDDEGFEKVRGRQCTVSRAKNDKVREDIKVPCEQWHFYLCKKRLRPPSKKKPAPPPGFSHPRYPWDQQPTPRKWAF